jgi:hypothetical protein
LSSRQKA